MAQVGLTEKRDYSLTYIIGVAGLISAMRTGQIDAFVANSPGPQQAQANASGGFYVNLAKENAHFPAFTDMRWSVVFAIEDSLRQSRPMAQNTILGLWRAQRLIQQDPDKAKTLVRPDFKDLDDTLVERCWADSAGLFPPDPRIDNAAFEKGLLLAAGKAGEAGVSVPTDSCYTNTIVESVADKV